jgi:hypothetical protein
MDGQAILTVSGAVVALVQLVKWMGLPDQRAPLAVLGLSALGVVFWGVTTGTFERTQAFGYFAGWIAIATSAAGVFGFTRSGPSSLTATKEPPPGAGANATVKMSEV